MGKVSPPCLGNFGEDREARSYIELLRFRLCNRVFTHISHLMLITPLEEKENLSQFYK